MDRPKFIDRIQKRRTDVIRSLGRQTARDIYGRMESPSHARRLESDPTITFQESNIDPRAAQLLQGRQDVYLGGGRTLRQIDENGTAHIQLDTRSL